jgi:hypothetical protein
VCHSGPVILPCFTSLLRQRCMTAAHNIFEATYITVTAVPRSYIFQHVKIWFSTWLFSSLCRPDATSFFIATVFPSHPSFSLFSHPIPPSITPPPSPPFHPLVTVNSFVQTSNIIHAMAASIIFSHKINHHYCTAVEVVEKQTGIVRWWWWWWSCSRYISIYIVRASYAYRHH